MKQPISAQGSINDNEETCLLKISEETRTTPASNITMPKIAFVATTALTGIVPYVLTMIKMIGAATNDEQRTQLAFDIIKMISVILANLLLNIFSAMASLKVLTQIKQSGLCKNYNALRIIAPTPLAV